MIPKKIHYCWFGGNEMPELSKKCLESWKKYCKDYEIIEWNEKNIDLNSNQYIKEAYKCKKWAFITDYVRLYVLYNYGGIYMDTDVEVIKPIDAFLSHKAFSGFENNNMIPTGIIGSEKGNQWIKDLLKEYDNIHFINSKGKMDLTTNVIRITNLTKKKYGLLLKSSYQELKGGIVTIYPFDFFCPKSHITKEIYITENTCTIHHFAGSWLPKNSIIRRNLKNKYIKKYGAKKGTLIANALFFSMHPIQLIKEIKLKVKK